MADVLENLIIRLEADVSQLKAGLQAGKTELAGFGSSTSSTMMQVIGYAKQVGQTFQNYWAPITAITGIAGKAISSLYQIMKEESQMARLLKAEFGDAAASVVLSAQVLADGTKFTEDQITDSVAETHGVLSQMGLGMGQQLKLTATAMNIAAARGVELGTVMDALQRSMMGSGRAMAGLGVNMKEDQVAAEGMGGAFKDIWADMTEEEKTQVRYNYLIEQSAKYSGQAQDAGSSLGGELNRLWGDIREDAVPALMQLSKWLSEIVDDFRRSYEKLSDWLSLTKNFERLTVLGMYASGVSTEEINAYKASLKAMDDADEKRREERKKEINEGGKVDEEAFKKKVKNRIANDKAEEAGRKKALKDEKELNKSILEEEEKRNQKAAESSYEAQTNAMYWTEDQQKQFNNTMITEDEAYQKDRTARYMKYHQNWIDFEYESEMKGIENQENGREESWLAWGEFRETTEAGLQGNLSKLFVNAFSGQMKSGEKMFQAFCNSMLTDYIGVASKMASQQLMGGLGALGAGITGTTSISLLGSGLVGGGLALGAVGAAVGSGVLGGKISKWLGGNAEEQAASELLAAVGFGFSAGTSTILAPLIVKALPKSWVKGLANWKSSWKAQETIGASQLGSFQEAIKSTFGFGEEANAAAGWGFTNAEAGPDALIDQLQYLAPLYSDIMGVATNFKDELGLTAVRAEELGSVLMQALAAGKKTLREATEMTRDFYIQLILAGDASAGVWAEAEKTSDMANRMAWLDDLKTEMADLTKTGYDYSDSQQEYLNAYIDLINKAYEGDEAAYELLQDTFRDTEEYTKGIQDNVDILQDQYDTLNKKLEAYNKLLDGARSLQSDLNELLLGQAVGWDEEKMNYLTQAMEIKEKAEAYREQFAGNADLLAYVDQWEKLALDKLSQDSGAAIADAFKEGYEGQVEEWLAQKQAAYEQRISQMPESRRVNMPENWYEAEGMTEGQAEKAAWQAVEPATGWLTEDQATADLDAVLENTPLDFVTPMEATANQMSADLKALGEQITAGEQLISDAVESTGQRIINAINGVESTNPLFGSGFTPGEVTPEAEAGWSTRSPNS